ncbi:MAG: sugar ABC transporter permease [Clostridia bacterium]|nr:sugar ABC transporter permease [Clostridia bacterium]
MAKTNLTVQNKPAKKKGLSLNARKSLQLGVLTIPGVIWFLVFSYIPMAGAVIAFKDYKPKRGIWGSEWVGFDNFEFLFSSNDAGRLVFNTVFHNFISIFLVAFVAVAIAVFMDLVDKRIYVKTYQTMLFLPRFISWVVVGFIGTILFHYEHGILNQVVAFFGGEAVSWYLTPKYWWFIIPAFGVWKTMGYTSLVYYGTIMGIDTQIFESAEIDGANTWGKIRHITLPLLRPTIIIMSLMSVGSIMRADFGLFYYVPNNSGSLYSVTDVLDTYIFRALRGAGDMTSSAAAGLFQSVVGLIMVVTCNTIVKKFESESALF